MTELKQFTVNVKGNFAAMKNDVLLKKQFMDVKYGYNTIVYWATDEMEEEMLEYLVKNEGKFGFKII